MKYSHFNSSQLAKVKKVDILHVPAMKFIGTKQVVAVRYNGSRNLAF